MSKLTKKATICFGHGMLRYFRSNSAEESRSISEIIKEALSFLASEDAEDSADFDTCTGAPSVVYADFVHSLKANGIL